MMPHTTPQDHPAAPGKYLIRHRGKYYWASLAYRGWTKNQMGINKPLLHNGRKP